MKRSLSALALALSISAAAVWLADRPSLAQGRNRPDKRDPEMAATIRRLTDRSTSGLAQRHLRNGGTGLSLAGRMQSVPLAKLDIEGDPVVGCADSITDANHFFGRDLETGDVYQTDPAEDAEYIATKHAVRDQLSVKEFQTYKDMITTAQNRGEATGNAVINIINADGAGEGFNDATPMSPEGGNSGTTLGQLRLNLFNQAAAIWGAFLDSRVPINVKSQFNSLTPCTTSGGVLGSAGANEIYRDFTGAEFTGTWYSVAETNKITGSDANADPTTGFDINATFNSDVDTGCLGTGTRFYYGFDNATPAGRINLLVVLLHEMGHGLGFQTFVNTATGANASGFTDVYSRHIIDQNLNLTWDQMTDAQRMASTTGGAIYWTGNNVNPASSYLTGGRDATTGRVKLYAPNPREAGSSVSHWDKSAFPNLLMEPAINSGLPLDLDLTRQQMEDIGWYRDSNNDGVPDTITNVSTAGSQLTIGSTATVTWNNGGGFNRNVIVELSTDGGNTFPVVLASNVA
ncbi:MAG: hypothetical protein JO314_10215, partial [Acidobacteria bacterium]|nr:hypothetical protein [Acidobacteriota bacterium]